MTHALGIDVGTTNAKVALVDDSGHLIAMPEFVETAGQSFTLSPDGRVVYVRGSAEQPVRYLRIIPHWVERMKWAVDEANK